MSKLREQSFEEVKKHHIEKKEIIKRGILTKKEVDKAITNGDLTPINIGKKSFVDHQELVGFIKK